MINYQRLFDFDGLQKKIGDIDAEYRKFVQNTENGSNIVKAALATYTKDLQTVLRELRALNLAQAGSNRKYEEQTKKTEEYSKRILELKGIIATLTDAQTANGVSIEKLKGALSLLKKEYDGLDPKAADFKAQQQQIADKVKLAKQAIDAQNTTLKAANQVLGSVTNTYARLSKETNEFRNRLRNLDNAFDLNTGKINKNNKEAVALLYQIQQNDAALKRMDASMGIHNRNVGHYTSALNGLRGNFLMLTGTLFGVDSAMTAVTKTFEVINTFDRYRSVIRFASDNTAAFSNNLAMLNKLADDTGMDIEVLYTKFGSFSVAGKAANMTVTETNRLFQSIVKAGGAYKMSNEAISLSLKAFEQIMNKNKLSMEEISQQLGDHLPGSLSLFATALGVSTEKLTQMIKNGDLFAKETLPLVADRLDKTVGPQAQNNVNTMGGAWNRLTNQAKLLIDQFAQDNGIQNFFSTAINGTATWLSAIREAVRSKEWASFVAVALGSPTEVRRMIGRQTSAEFERVGLEAERQGIFNSLSKMTPQQRELLIQGKQQQFQEAARLGTSSQVKAKESQELLRILNIYKEINKELKVANDLAKKPEQIDQIKALNKEIRETQKLLEAGASRNKNFLNTSEGVTLKAKYDALIEERKQLKVAAGTRQPENLKKELTQLEKLIEETEKLTKTLMDDALSDVKSGSGLVSLPEKATKKWYELYGVLDQLARKLGVEIPSAIEKTKTSLDRVLGKDALSNLKVNNVSSTMADTIPSAILPNEEMKTAKSWELPGLDNFLNNTLRQETERFDLQRQFSGRLRRLKQEEKTELLRILAEIQKAERDGDDEKKKRLKEQYDYTLNLAKDEAAERQRIQAQFAQASLELSQAGFDLYASIQEKKLTQLEKQQEYELALAGENEEAKAAITERFARQTAEIRRRQAVAEKAMAAFQIGVNTASAIISMLANPGGPAGIALSVVAGATGALQLANVLAKQIPAFKKGTRYAPEGPALVAEEGAELHESQGKYFLHEKPSVVPLKRGDKIYTAAETSRMLADQYKSQELNTVITRSEIPSLMAKNLQLSQQKAQMNMNYAIAQQLNLNADRIGQTVASAVSNLPVNETHFDEDGVWERQRRLNSVVTYRKVRHGF